MHAAAGIYATASWLYSQVSSLQSPSPKQIAAPVDEGWVDASRYFQTKTIEDIKSIRVPLATGVEAEEIIYSENLSIPPAQKIFNAKEIMIGDAHGNVLRILYDLIYGGVFKTPSQEIWNELIDIISCADRLTDLQLFRFERILCNEISKTKQPSQVIFIGDLLAERQGNDNLMFTLFFEMKKKDLKYKIMISNHDLVFLKYYLLNSYLIELDKEYCESLYSFLLFHQRYIIHNMDALYENYLEHLELFDYKPEIGLFICHATVKEKQIMNLCDLFLVNKSQNTADLLQNLKKEFEGIKKNQDLFKLFLEEHAVRDFCWTRIDEEYNTALKFLPGIDIIVQGHDLNKPYFASELTSAYPPSLSSHVSGKSLKRVVLDNRTGKSGLRQTHDTDFNFKPLRAYLAIIPKDKKV
ncbi:MAG: metallophosphoesterase [Bdellovibrionota bacterium]